MKVRLNAIYRTFLVEGMVSLLPIPLKQKIKMRYNLKRFKMDFCSYYFSTSLKINQEQIIRVDNGFT